MSDRDHAWLAGLFGTIDAMDADAFAAYLTPDGEFCFANLPAVQGRDAIRAFVGAFYQSLRALRHQLVESWRCGEDVICRGVVTYVRHDGKEVSVPFANIMKCRGGLVQEYRIYADTGPLREA